MDSGKNETEAHLPQEFCCEQCGSVVFHSFTLIKQKLPPVYCTNCAAAFVYLKNHLCDKDYYNPDILVTATSNQSNFGSKSFDAVFSLIRDENDFYKRYLNKPEENT